MFGSHTHIRSLLNDWAQSTLLPFVPGQFYMYRIKSGRHSLACSLKVCKRINHILVWVNNGKSNGSHRHVPTDFPHWIFMLPLLLSNLVASKPLGPCHSLPCSEPFSGKGEKEKKEDEEVKAPSAEAGRPKDFGMIRWVRGENLVSEGNNHGFP